MQKTQLALFPLQIFLLPGEESHLHIFEDRYKQLLDDCGNAGGSFGIPYALNGYLSGFGCVVSVTEVIKRYPNGSADIAIACTDLFKVDQFFMRMGEKLYPGGDVIIMHASDADPVSQELMEKLDAYIKQSDPSKFESLLSPVLTVFDIALILKLDEESKLKLVKAKTQAKREAILAGQIMFLEAIQKQKSSIAGDIFLN
jgi:Lon protease-like protein